VRRGLSARIESIIGHDFKPVVEQTVYGVQFAYRGEESFLIESSSPIAYMVMRDRFDQALVEKARRVGTEIHEGEAVVQSCHSSDGVMVSTAQGRYHAKFLIGADGANSLVAQHLFPERRHQRMPTLESEVDIRQADPYLSEKTVLIDIGATRKGYAWIFPKQKRLSVGVAEFRGKASSPKTVFDRFVHHQKSLTERSIPRPAGHPLPLYSGGRDNTSASLVQGRAVLIGDAGHLVDPLFGEGIYYAVRSGQLAAGAILETVHDRSRSLLEYDHALGREIYPEFRVASRMARLVYSFPRFCHRLIPNYQEVVRLYYGVLQGRTTYQGFLAQAKGLVKHSVRRLLLEALPLHD
jgi:geranylgeranyl reductase family protein